MSRPNWPSDLPSLTFPNADQSYMRQPHSNVIRTRMDAGPAKVRRRARAQAIDIRFTVQLSERQFETEQRFYWDTLAEVGQFDWIDPATHKTASFRYVEPTQATALGGGFWRAQMHLERLP